MGKTSDLTMRERLVRAGILLPAPRVPEPRDAAVPAELQRQREGRDLRQAS